MKVGKTTFGTKMPGHLLVAFERGYNALPGAMVIDATTWGDMKQILRELKKPEVKEVYKSIIIDTIDLGAEACQKYICNQLGIEDIGEGGWTNNGWAKYKKEFEETFRTLAQLGYAVVFISHDKEKTVTPQNDVAYQQIRASLQTSALAIVENMSDIIAYAHPKILPDGNSKVVLTLRDSTNAIRCGCRFKYIANEIDFSYEALTKALNDAIDKENQSYVTDEKQEVPEVKEYDYDALMEEFQKVVGDLLAKSPSDGAKVTAIVNKYLGKGKKVMETTPEQAELIYLIVSEIKEDLL